MSFVLVILRAFSILSIVAISAYLLFDFNNIYQSIFHNVRKENILGHLFPTGWSSIWYWVIQLLLICIKAFVIYLLFVFIDVIKSFYKEHFFTQKNGKNLMLIGSGIILVIILLGIIELPFNMYETMNDKSLPNRIPYKSGYAFGETIGDRLPQLMFSLFFILLGNVIRRGEVLQQENDLTI